MDRVELTKDQALLAINDRLGETVSVGLHAFDPNDGLVAGTVIEVRGRLSRLYEPESMASMPVWERNLHEGVYMVGNQLVDLGSTPGRIKLHGGGLDFRLTADLILSVAWDEAE